MNITIIKWRSLTINDGLDLICWQQRCALKSSSNLSASLMDYTFIYGLQLHLKGSGTRWWSKITHWRRHADCLLQRCDEVQIWIRQRSNFGSFQQIQHSTNVLTALLSNANLWKLKRKSLFCYWIHVPRERERRQICFFFSNSTYHTNYIYWMRNTIFSLAPTIPEIWRGSLISKVGHVTPFRPLKILLHSFVSNAGDKSACQILCF